ncbi:Uncharacterized protein PHSC3_001356 [Chlamydiales bacterium STE3]|nr:Uncharacterized protein PHSC3_001356 [Chlamydiales bacterium STE3]
MKTRVFLKLFAGILISSEMRMHLNLSIRWKEAQILKEFDPEHLFEVHFHEENYVGKFLSANILHLSELQEQEKIILAKMKEYCPNLKVDKLKIKIFPQQFIS